MSKLDAMATIRETLGEFENDFDVEGMFDALYEYDGKGGFVEREGVDFWECAQEFDISE